MENGGVKKHLRDVLAERGYEKIDGLVLSGSVFVNDERATSGAVLVGDLDQVEVRGLREFVSRSGAKLAGALEDFGISPKGRVCLDLGASTGGFTQVLVRAGAAHVYSVDLGYGIMDYSLRREKTVTVLDRTDAREISKDWFSAEHWQSIALSGLFVASDISFISLRSVIQPFAVFLAASGIRMEGVFLLKPQYEKSSATEHGILRDDALRAKIEIEFLEFARGLGFDVVASMPAQIKGAKGNQEIVVFLRWGADE